MAKVTILPRVEGATEKYRRANGYRIPEAESPWDCDEDFMSRTQYADNGGAFDKPVFDPLFDTKPLNR